MKFLVLATLAVSAHASAYSLKHTDGATPMSKVLQMLKGMLVNGQAAKEDEAAAFQKYSAFCHDTAMQTGFDIKTANTKIEGLSADIQKYESDITKLAGEIEGLDADVAVWESEKQSSADERAGEKAEYETTREDYSESIDALERAIAVLKKQDFATAQPALLQVALMKKVPESAKRVITNFLEQDPEVDGYLGYSAPEAAAYEFQSGGVTDMLEKLKNKFEDELAALEKEETNARHAFDMMQQDLANQISTGTSNRNEKAAAKTNHEQSLADAKADLTETTLSRDTDVKYLAELNAGCDVKAQEFEARQKLRADELEAISQAIDILSSKVKGLAEKHLPTLVQQSLVQLRSRSQNVLQDRVAAFLKQQAQKIGSRILFQLATQAAEDPFKKVKAMIQDLIVRLMEEANQEAEHKGWCDTELATNEQTRKAKSALIDQLTSKIDILAAQTAEIGQQIADLNAAVAAIDEAVAQSTEDRQTEHAKNTATVQDCKDAQAGVAQALAVLKEFYASAAEATALAQVKGDEPSTWTEPYKGMGGDAGGVVGMLEVIQSDFARLEAETSADEEQAAAEYKKFMDDSALDKLAKSKDVEHLTYTKQQKEAAHATTLQDRESAQAELDAALEYYEKLKPSCVDAGVSYDDRVARRKEEIESLQEALKILNGESFDA